MKTQSFKRYILGEFFKLCIDFVLVFPVQVRVAALISIIFLWGLVGNAIFKTLTQTGG